MVGPKVMEKLTTAGHLHLSVSQDENLKLIDIVNDVQAKEVSRVYRAPRVQKVREEILGIRDLLD